MGVEEAGRRLRNRHSSRKRSRGRRPEVGSPSLSNSSRSRRVMVVEEGEVEVEERTLSAGCWEVRVVCSGGWGWGYKMSCAVVVVVFFSFFINFILIFGPKRYLLEGQASVYEWSFGPNEARDCSPDEETAKMKHNEYRLFKVYSISLLPLTCRKHCKDITLQVLGRLPLVPHNRVLKPVRTGRPRLCGSFPFFLYLIEHSSSFSLRQMSVKHNLFPFFERFPIPDLYQYSLTQ